MTVARWTYFDASVLTKRYVAERGSVEASLLLARRTVVSSALSTVELTSAFRQRQRAGDLTSEQLESILADLRQIRSTWELIAASRIVLDRAEELLRVSRLRTVDAVHVASALVFEAGIGRRVPFVTADTVQAETAAREGLQTIHLH